MSTTVEELQARLRSPGQVVRADDLDGAQKYHLMTVFETLQDGRCRTWVLAHGVAIRPLEFDSEAEAVAEAEGRIFETVPQPGSLRHLEGLTPTTVEDLKDAMAGIGRDPDNVTRAEVLREASPVEGMTVFERRADGSVRVYSRERGREFERDVYPDEAAAVADAYERLRSSAGHFVTDLKVEQLRIRAQQFRELMARAGQR